MATPLSSLGNLGHLVTSLEWQPPASPLVILATSLVWQPPYPPLCNFGHLDTSLAWQPPLCNFGNFSLLIAALKPAPTCILYETEA